MEEGLAFSSRKCSRESAFKRFNEFLPRKAILLPETSDKGKWRSRVFYLCVHVIAFSTTHHRRLFISRRTFDEKGSLPIHYHFCQLAVDCTYLILGTRRIFYQRYLSTRIYDRRISTEFLPTSSKNFKNFSKNCDESWGQPAGLCRK